MTPSDIGLDSSPAEPEGNENSGQRRAWSSRALLVILLFLAGLCTSFMLSGHVSGRLIAQRQLEQMDSAAERLNSDVNSAAGASGR